jgi:hypothetical protein
MRARSPCMRSSTRSGHQRDLLELPRHRRRRLGDGRRGLAFVVSLRELRRTPRRARARQRLAQLAAVAVERDRLDHLTPGIDVGAARILDARLRRHVDRLADRAAQEGLRRRHHVQVRGDRDVALALAAAFVGAVEDRQVLIAQMRRALDRHRAAAVVGRGLDLLCAEAERLEQVALRRRRAPRCRGRARSRAELRAERSMR